MLINLWGIVEGGNIICDSMPYIILGSYLVGVKEIFIEWKTQRNSFIGILTTSLIAKSPENQHQELIVVPQEYPGRFLFYTPTHISYYKTRLHQFNTSVFKIDTLEKDLPNIKRIYFQLKLIDVGFQQSLEQ